MFLPCPLYLSTTITGHEQLTSTTVTTLCPVDITRPSYPLHSYSVDLQLPLITAVSPFYSTYHAVLNSYGGQRFYLETYEN